MSIVAEIANLPLLLENSRGIKSFDMTTYHTVRTEVLTAQQPHSAPVSVRADGHSSDFWSFDLTPSHTVRTKVLTAHQPQRGENIIA